MYDSKGRIIRISFKKNLKKSYVIRKLSNETKDPEKQKQKDDSPTNKMRICEPFDFFYSKKFESQENSSSVHISTTNNIRNATVDPLFSLSFV